MMRVCRECGDDEFDDTDLCDFCTETFGATCGHLVYDLCATCDLEQASAVAPRDSQLPEEGR